MFKKGDLVQGTSGVIVKCIACTGSHTFEGVVVSIDNCVRTSWNVNDISSTWNNRAFKLVKTKHKLIRI